MVDEFICDTPEVRTFIGKVKEVHYHKGRFRNAMRDESSEFNENNCIGIEAGGDRPVRMLVKQIAGAIARRIVCECQVGDTLATGQKLGMIKFGSRTELYIPKDAAFELELQLGQKVAAGRTIVGRLR